jgi:hypothetical protein
MKNVSQIISFLQNKPQFSKLLEYRCINKLKSSLLLSIQNYIKKGYIKNNTLFFILRAKLNKHDEQNNIQMLQTILNSQMILKSEKFLDCIDIKINDIVFFVDHNPDKEVTLHITNAHKHLYKERSDGNIDINIQDEKLQQIANNIVTIIKNNK